MNLTKFYAGFFFIIVSCFGNEEPLFALFSIPKAGTKLAENLIYELTGKKESIALGTICEDLEDQEEEIIRAKLIQYKISPEQYYGSHFHCPAVLSCFTKLYPDIPVIVIVRDLRDVLVSAVFYIDNPSAFSYARFFAAFPDSKEDWDQLSFSAKLFLTITGGGENIVDVYPNQLKVLKGLCHRPNVLLIRYEDLVGPRGGGDATKQKETIAKVAKWIHTEVSEEDIGNIAERIYGGASTFREGKIGMWRKYYSKGLIDLFKEYYNPYLLELGYEQNEDWN